MNIQEVIRTINQMQADGIIDSYAIGGSFDAATFEDILTRHTLTGRWAQFQRQFLSDTP